MRVFLACVVAALAVAVANATMFTEEQLQLMQQHSSTSFALPAFYHKTDVILDEVQRLAKLKPNLLKTEKVSVEGDNLELLVVTVNSVATEIAGQENARSEPPAATKEIAGQENARSEPPAATKAPTPAAPAAPAETQASTPPSPASSPTEASKQATEGVSKLRREATPKQKFLINFGIHARELISSETALELMQIFAGEKKAAADINLDTVLSHTEFKFIPVMNPLGRKKVEAGDECWRKNSRGVDLNRNFDSNWAEGSSTTTAEDYHGTGPLSEPESKILSKVAKDYKPVVYVDMHSGTKVMMTTPAFTTAKDPPPASLRVLEQLNPTSCNCTIGGAARIIGYNSPGCTTDFLEQGVGAKYSYAFEIYGKAIKAVMSSGHMDASQAAAASEHLKQPDASENVDPMGHVLRRHHHHRERRHHRERVEDGAWDNLNTSLLGEMVTASSQEQLHDCFHYFNPGTEAERQEVVSNWANTLLRLSELVFADQKK